MTLIRVVVADDDASVRSALSEVLQADGRFVVVGTASTADEAVRTSESSSPDLVLLDVRMPGGGAAAATAIRGSRAHAGVGFSTDGPVVVAVSAQSGVSVVASMVRAGATGFLAKGRLRDLPDLLVRCASGEVVLAVPGGAAAIGRLVRSGGPDD